MNKTQTLLLAFLFVAITIVLRLSDHPWNFSPMGALFLFSGFYLQKRYMWLPLIALVATDMIIGTYQWQVMMAVYGTYAIMLFGARAIRGVNVSSVLGMSVGSAILFFITTNFAHWMWFGGYAHDFSGLMQAYIAAIPFFRNSLMGYVFYSGLFFAIREITMIRINEVKVIKGIVIYPNRIT